MIWSALGFTTAKIKCQFTFGSLPDQCNTWFYKQILVCTYMDKTIWHVLMQHLSCICRAQPKIAGTRLEYFFGGAVIGPGWAILRRRACEREVFVLPFHIELQECYSDHCFLCISKSLHVEIAILLRDQLWSVNFTVISWCTDSSFCFISGWKSEPLPILLGTCCTGGHFLRGSRLR